MIIEGVQYYRFVVSFRLADGRRRRWVRWAPAACYLNVSRELSERFSAAELPPGSDVRVSQ